MRVTRSLSHVEISAKNLIHNIKQFRSLINKNTKISVAIKGNAYGHGQYQVVKILERYVDYFQVDNIEELKLLRKTSDQQAFLFGYVQKEDLPTAIKLGCILAFFSLEQLNELNDVARRLGIKQKIHIPFDAYLGREGFLLRDLPEIFAEIKKCKHIKVTGIYAHFANIEDTSNFSHAQKQIREYEKAIKKAREFGFKNLQTHISATSGILAYEKKPRIHPIVRLGIGAYGMWPSKNLSSFYRNSKYKLWPVLSWKTKIAQVKTLPPGSSIGYGLTYTTKKETKIAIVPQCYADG